MSNRLPVLAAEINAAHKGVEDAAKLAAENAIKAGEALIEAKSLLKHGEWRHWIQENCAFSERTAQLYMKIVRLGLKSATVADLGIKGASKCIGQYVDKYYDPFYHCDAAGKEAWLRFTEFMMEFLGWEHEAAGAHIEWVLQRQFRTPDEWLGSEGATFRKTCTIREPSTGFKEAWRIRESDFRAEAPK